MESLQEQFKRLEAWLYQKPLICGLGCFVVSLIFGLILTAFHQPKGILWLEVAP